MNNTTKKSVYLVALAGLLSTGCQALQPQKPTVVRYQQPTTQAACSMPVGKRVDSAFSHAKQNLASAACQHQYDRYFDSLINVAMGDPSQENKKRFSAFLTWSYEQGIISKRQGKSYYTRYFSPTFVSLSDTHNVCAATRNKDEMLRGMQAELKQKKKGILEVAGDRDAYFATLRQHNDIVLVLEATALACVADR